MKIKIIRRIIKGVIIINKIQFITYYVNDSFLLCLHKFMYFLKKRRRKRHNLQDIYVHIYYVREQINTC